MIKQAKKTILPFVKCMALAVHCMIDKKTLSTIDSLCNLFFTYWISSEFKCVGKNVVISRGLQMGGGKRITLGKDIRIDKNVVLVAWSKYAGDNFHSSISIGDGSTIGESCNITSINEIKIGDNVLIGRRVTITDNAHGKITATDLDIPPKLRPLSSKGKIDIQDNVWIGDKVTILPGVVIGYGSIIGANAVVVNNIPPRSVVVGVPGKIIKVL